MHPLALPEIRPASASCIDALYEQLGAQQVTVDADACATASRDHAWLSPVLTAAIPDRALAEVVVRPRTEEELAATLAIAYAHGAAVTARGKGTGNYGQAVPLAQGIVIDTSRMEGVSDIGSGWIEAATGTTFTRLEQAARQTGQELAMFPSTSGSTLGGFLAGGAGGTGSIENGMVWDGYVSELCLVPCWDAPEPQWTSGDAVTTHLHAYGTTGIMTSARVKLVPARRWTTVFASFSTIGSAAAAGRSILECDPLPRNLSIDDAQLVATLRAHRAMPIGRVSLRAIVAESVVGEAQRAVLVEGGEVESVLEDAVSLCVSLSFNHVTLRAKRVHPDICHVQVAGPATVERYDEVCAAMPNAMLHLDAYARGKSIGYGGLFLAPFHDEITLRRGMDRLRELGVQVTDPHTWVLGGHGPLDAVIEAATVNDPSALLNPGKLPRVPASRVAGHRSGGSAP